MGLVTPPCVGKNFQICPRARLLVAIELRDASPGTAARVVADGPVIDRGSDAEFHFGRPRVQRSCPRSGSLGQRSRPGSAAHRERLRGLRRAHTARQVVG